MKELQEKTIAALEKQVELLTKDGVSRDDREMANQSVNSLTTLLSELKRADYSQPLTAE